MTPSHTTSRTMSDVLALSEIERAVVNHIIRQRHGSLAQLSQQLEQPTDDLQSLLTQLVIEGFLSYDSETETYRISMRSRPKRPSTDKLWDAISD